MYKKSEDSFIRKIDFHLYTDEIIKYLEKYIYNFSNPYRIIIFYIMMFKTTKKAKYFNEIFRWTRMYSLNHQYSEFLCDYYNLEDEFNGDIKKFKTFVKENNINIKHLKSFANYIYENKTWSYMGGFWKDFKEEYR